MLAGKSSVTIVHDLHKGGHSGELMELYQFLRFGIAVTIFCVPLEFDNYCILKGSIGRFPPGTMAAKLSGTLGSVASLGCAGAAIRVRTSEQSAWDDLTPSHV